MKNYKHAYDSEKKKTYIFGNEFNDYVLFCKKTYTFWLKKKIMLFFFFLLKKELEHTLKKKYN